MKGGAKRTTFVALVILVAGVGVAARFAPLGGMTAAWAFACLALTFGFAFLICARVKCGACGRRLSGMFPVGSLLLLWLARQNCRACGAVVE